MLQHLMPFGVGTRQCGGQNLAHITVRAAIAAIVSNFEISANRTETNEGTMQIKDAFVSNGLVAHARCILICCHRSSTLRRKSADSSSPRGSVDSFLVYHIISRPPLFG